MTKLITVNVSTGKYIQDIRDGLSTAKLIAEKHNIAPESVSTCLRRARKAGIITATLHRLETNNSNYLVYAITKGVKYKITNNKSGPSITGATALPNKYGENMYLKLDDYLYSYPDPKNKQRILS